MNRKTALILITVLVLSISFFVIFTVNNSRNFANLNSQGENIICFGNSITVGVGAKKKYSYPNLLQKKLEANVINAGKSGDTTFEAVKRLEKDVLDKNPLIVIVEFGGNDYIQQISKSKTLKNLDKIVKKILQNNAMVILVGVQCGLLGNEYKKGLEKIGQKYNIPVIENVQQGITSIDYKNDRIHPNKKGYRIIAERIYKWVKKLLTLSNKTYLLKDETS